MLSSDSIKYRWIIVFRLVNSRAYGPRHDFVDRIRPDQGCRIEIRVEPAIVVIGCENYGHPIMQWSRDLALYGDLSATDAISRPQLWSAPRRLYSVVRILNWGRLASAISLAALGQ
jgi:hypothetical protein